MESRRGELVRSVKQETDQKETELEIIRERIRQAIDHIFEEGKPVQFYSAQEWEEIFLGRNFYFRQAEEFGLFHPENVHFGLHRFINQADSLDITEETEGRLEVTIGLPFFLIQSDRWDREVVSFKPKVSVSIQKDKSLGNPERNVLAVYIRLIDPNANRSNGQFRDNSFDAKDKRCEFVDSFVKELEALSFAEVKENFESLSKAQMIEIAFLREKIFDKFLCAYVEQMNFVVAEADELNILRQGLNQLPFFGFSDSDLVTNDVLRMIPGEHRFAFSTYRNRTISQVQEDLEQRAEALMVCDGKRNQFHRSVEFFAFLFFHGMSPEQVRWAIEMKRSAQRDEAIPLSGNIFVECKKSPLQDSYKNKPTYTISFGEGPGYASVSWDSAWPAGISKNSYKSKVREGRTFQEDKDLVDRIAKELQSLFPLLEVHSRFFETGSYHEKFRYFDLEISAESLFLVTQSCGKSPEVVRDEIFSYIREEIEKAQSPARTE